MDWRNRIGLYGSYFLGVSGIGFTLPYLPVYLGDRHLSNAAIGIISTLAAVAGLVQFPLGLFSDWLGRRKPILIAALVLLTLATVLLPLVWAPLALAVLVMLFAENGACRATIESLAGAEAAHLAPPSEVGAALGALRFWKPISIVLVALAGSILAENVGIEAILWPLAALQGVGVLVALPIHEATGPSTNQHGVGSDGAAVMPPVSVPGRGLRDGTLWVFVLAVVLFHFANAPGGVYLARFLEEELAAPRRVLAYAFVISMIVWMLVVRPVGRLTDRVGRRPLLIVGWITMAVRLALVAVAQTPGQVLAIQTLDGLANGLFAVLAAAWVTDRLADPRRVGTAQVLVGTALVGGSAAGPLVAGLIVDVVGYRGMFGLLAGVGTMATVLVILCVPETLRTPQPGPLATPSDLSTTP
jgi:MFS family permease